MQLASRGIGLASRCKAALRLPSHYRKKKLPIPPMYIFVPQLYSPQMEPRVMTGSYSKSNVEPTHISALENSRSSERLLDRVTLRVKGLRGDDESSQTWERKRRWWIGAQNCSSVAARSQCGQPRLRYRRICMMTAKHTLKLVIRRNIIFISFTRPPSASGNLLLQNNSSLLNSGTTWHSYSGRDPSNMTWNLPTSGTCEDEIERIEI